MSISLHAAVVPNWLQILHAMRRMLEKAESWASTEGIDEGDLFKTRLIEDMLPLGYQVKSCWTHSKLALDGVRSGTFSPDMSPPPATFSACEALLDEAIAACDAIDEAELEKLADNDLVFTIGDKLRLDFTVQDFLLSFTTPNFFFHSATAYDILRMKGLPVGKQDFLGRLRLKN